MQSPAAYTKLARQRQAETHNQAAAHPISVINSGKSDCAAKRQRAPAKNQRRSLIMTAEKEQTKDKPMTLDSITAPPPFLSHIILSPFGLLSYPLESEAAHLDVAQHAVIAARRDHQHVANNRVGHLELSVQTLSGHGHSHFLKQLRSRLVHMHGILLIA